MNVPVKVPGAPEITQPITIEPTAGQALDVDVLSQYVKPGVDKDGVAKPVVESSLKVVDGNATIVDGKVHATAGTGTTSVTFEVYGRHGHQ